MVTLEDIIVTLEQVEPMVDFAALFGNDHPVELEIGCGKGSFLLDQARAHPDRNYFGVEWANKYFRYAADRMRRWVRCRAESPIAEAGYLVGQKLPPGSLGALHIYHPDPWPKKRHHKRRLFKPEFIEAAVRALQPGGRWAIQTDHAEYFQVIHSLLTDRPELEPTDFADPEYGTDDARTETNFEVKYLREGRDIHRLAFRKIAACPEARQA